jgi:hypothetical protein
MKIQKRMAALMFCNHVNRGSPTRRHLHASCVSWSGYRNRRWGDNPLSQNQSPNVSAIGRLNAFW